MCVAVPKNGMESIATKVLLYYHATDWKGHGYLALRQEPTGGSIFDKGTRSQRSSELCPVPDKINTVTRRGIGLHGQQKEELYARVQTESGVRKHAA